jgi:hypothetical protein
MASQDAQPIFCDKIGTASPECCYTSEQNSPICRGIFSRDPSVFNDVCDDGLCLQHCAKPSFIFGSILDREAWDGTGVRPIMRYRTCANMPNMAGYLGQNLLEPTILSQVEDHLPKTASSDALKNVSLAVTDCLTATCRNARDVERCGYACSGVNLLINSTTPNITGLNECLNTLCTGNQSSLPYADADIVGIGVSTSLA